MIRRMRRRMNYFVEEYDLVSSDQPFLIEKEEFVYKQNQIVIIIRGEILVDARTELSDIVREHIVPRLPEADSGEYAGTDNLHNIFQHFIDQRTAAIDTVTFYRTERELPLTYALLAEIVGQELGFEPRKQEDLVALGRDRDIYEAIRGVQDVMAALEEGLRQGLRNREIF